MLFKNALFKLVTLRLTTPHLHARRAKEDVLLWLGRNLGYAPSELLEGGLIGGGDGGRPMSAPVGGVVSAELRGDALEINP